jgi:hypothetical protein
VAEWWHWGEKEGEGERGRDINKEDSGSYARCLPEGRKCALGACLQVTYLILSTLIEVSTSVNFAKVTKFIGMNIKITIANVTLVTNFYRAWRQEGG